MERFWALGPEVPLHVVVAEVCFGIALLGMDEVGELVWVADEEDWCVVSYEVPVSFFGVELHGEASDIAFSVGGAFFAGDGGEAEEHFCLLTDLGEDIGFGVFGDVVGNGEGAVGARALGVDDSFWDAFAVEVLHLFEERDILHENRASWSGGQGVLAGDWGAVGGGHVWAFWLLIIGH